MSTIEDNSPERFREAANDPQAGPALVIADTSIRRDVAGRYCLNDLHRAAGGEKRHGPSYWLSNAQTRSLVDELEAEGTTGNSAVWTVEGAAGGTYVAKELVYAYAMWISPAFHLKVIRAYDALVAKPPAPAFRLPQSFAEALRLAADQAEQIQQQQAVIERQRPAVAFVESYVKAGNSLGIRKVVKLLGVKEREFIARLIGAKVLFRQSGDLMPYAEFTGEARGLFDVKTGNKNDHDWTQTRFTPKGVVWIAWKLYKRRMSEAEVASAADEEE